MFKFQAPSRYSPLDAIHLWRCFFHCSKHFSNLSVLMPFSACHFLFHLFHISKMFPFEDFFHPGTQKKVPRGEIGCMAGVEHGGHAIFSQKLMNTQHGVGRCAHKSPIMKWANTWRESSKKNSLKLNTASHNTTSWYTDTEGFLEHSPSGGSLYY